MRKMDEWRNGSASVLQAAGCRFESCLIYCIDVVCAGVHRVLIRPGRWFDSTHVDMMTRSTVW